MQKNKPMYQREEPRSRPTPQVQYDAMSDDKKQELKRFLLEATEQEFINAIGGYRRALDWDNDDVHEFLILLGVV